MRVRSREARPGSSCREEKYGLQPVWETSEREETYTVSKPVWETSEKECVQTCWKQTWDTVEKECRRVVCKPVTDIVEREICETVLKPCTTVRTVCEDRGSWTYQQKCLPGLPLLTLQCSPCMPLPQLAWTQTPGLSWYKPKWCPNVVTRQVECTTMVPEVVTS